jgi:hypothetical protein
VGSFWKIFSNPSRSHTKVEVGPHPDALQEIKFLPVDDRGVSDILDTGKRGLGKAGLETLVGLELESIAPPTEAEVAKLRQISIAVGLNPDYMSPEVIDSAHKGLPPLSIDDIDVENQQYFKKDIFSGPNEEQQARMAEHVRAIKKHIDADRNASWRDDTCGGF